MNSNPPQRRTDAFTLIELLCVIAIISILAALILSATNQARGRALRVGCESHLRQIGIAFQLFQHDHDGKFPMAVPLAEGGTREFVENGYAVGGEFYFAYRHFQVLSNELGLPEMLICLRDVRLPATNFPGLQNSNVSYFVGVKADFGQPDSLLAGDRNLTANWFPNPSILSVSTTNRLWWTVELHQLKGNLLFADGRVEEANSSSLAASAGEQSPGTDLFMPTVRFNPNAPPVWGSGSGGSSGSGPGMGATPPAPAVPPTGGSAGSGYRSADNQPRFSPTPMLTVSNQNPAGPTITNRPGVRVRATSPTTPTVGSNVVVMPTEPAVSPFDQRIIKILRHLLISFYFLILLVLLLWVLSRWWRRSQRRKMPR